MKLSRPQHQAIHHKDGPVLLLAVPGSGKTTVIINRIIQLQKDGISPKKILSITYSKAQSLDMKQRLLELSPNDSRLHETTLSTIHAFCYGVITTYMKRRNKTIRLIENDHQFNKSSAIRRLYHQLYRKHISSEALHMFFTWYSYHKNTGSLPESLLQSGRERIADYHALYTAYEGLKKDNHLMDFEDMLTICLEILRENPHTLSGLRRRFQYIQVDEGQDTSPIQFEIVQLISKPKNNLFIVADDDQSIYRFRGADPSLLLSFQEMYPMGTVITMEDNYRSSLEVVQIANAFIKSNVKRYKKSLNAVNQSHSPVQIITTKTPTEQLNDVIKELKRQPSTEDYKTAILYRNNLSALHLIHRLVQSGIAFFQRSPSSDYFQDPILKDMIDIHAFSNNLWDLETFERIYYKFNAYIDKAQIAKLRSTGIHTSIIDQLIDNNKHADYFQKRLKTLRRHLSKIAVQSPHKALATVFDHSGYCDYLSEKARRDQSGKHSFDQYIDTLKAIAKDCKTFQAFLDRLKLLERRQNEARRSASHLTLSTLHGAKGLEFERVFIIDLIETILPSAYGSSKSSTDDLEEERRLFYVGMTRAKVDLSLLSFKSMNGNQTQRSIFVDEIATIKKNTLPQN